MKRAEIQQALLKPAYARLYPGVPANEWCPVTVMRELVQTSRGHRGGSSSPAAQELDPEHFSFRGTASAGSKAADREGRSARRNPRRSK